MARLWIGSTSSIGLTLEATPEKAIEDAAQPLMALAVQGKTGREGISLILLFETELNNPSVAYGILGCAEPRATAPSR